MEEKLGAKCNINDVVLNERYCLLSEPQNPYLFIVIEVNKIDKWIRVKYQDNTYGIFHTSLNTEFYRYSITPLERELL